MDTGTTLLSGNFPNHSPNPEDAEAMDSAVAATVAAGADLGIIFDTDVDRSAVIDAAGQGSVGGPFPFPFPFPPHATRNSPLLY